MLIASITLLRIDDDGNEKSLDNGDVPFAIWIEIVLLSEAINVVLEVEEVFVLIVVDSLIIGVEVVDGTERMDDGVV